MWLLPLLIIGLTVALAVPLGRYLARVLDREGPRNRIERCFSKLKHFRRFATRYDRRAIHFLGFVHLAATMIWLR